MTVTDEEVIERIRAAGEELTGLVAAESERHATEASGDRGALWFASAACILGLVAVLGWVGTRPADTAPSDADVAATADDCSTSHGVQAERLDITKQVNRTSVSLGDTVAYTVAVTNVGTVDFTATNPATAIDDLSDVLDDATWVGNATASAGNVSFTSPNLTWTGPLAVGNSVTLTYSVKVNATATGSGALYNTIGTTGASGSNCPVGSPTSECETVTQITLPPPPPARPGPITPTPIPVTR